MMAAVLEKLKVLDLTSGVAGSMTTMLLGDNGADVTKIEPPGGDPARHEAGPQQLGYKVWQRGKRSAFLDLTKADDKAVLLALAKTAAKIRRASFGESVCQYVYISVVAVSLNKKH